MTDSRERELIDVMDAWDRAMVTNDAGAIGAYMADDWMIVGTEGRSVGRASFLDLVRSGDLTHDVMETHEPRIRLYGDTAVVVARGVSGGRYRGRQFHTAERVSCVFVRQKNHWLCVHTHLSSLMDEENRDGRSGYDY